MSISENLHNLGTLMKTNLEEKGIDGLTGNEGLTTLTNKILDIECNGSSKNIIAHVTGNNVSLGWSTSWLITTGDVVIDWGDGTSDTVNNPHTTLSHTYTDANGHLIIFDGTVTSLGYSCFHQSNLTNIVIPNSITSIGTQCFYGCTSLVDYELYWETPPIQYDSGKMPVNTDTVFTIPYGTTSVYVNAGYPSDRLVEREST